MPSSQSEAKKTILADTQGDIIPRIQKKFNFDEKKVKDLYEWSKWQQIKRNAQGQKYKDKIY